MRLGQCQRISNGLWWWQNLSQGKRTHATVLCERLACPHLRAILTTNLDHQWSVRFKRQDQIWSHSIHMLTQQNLGFILEIPVSSDAQYTLHIHCFRLLSVASVSRLLVLANWLRLRFDMIWSIWTMACHSRSAYSLLSFWKSYEISVHLELHWFQLRLRSPLCQIRQPPIGAFSISLQSLTCSLNTKI